MIDRHKIREELLELEKLRQELLEEAMKYIEYLIHREKENQDVLRIYDTNDIELLSDD